MEISPPCAEIKCQYEERRFLCEVQLASSMLKACPVSEQLSPMSDLLFPIRSSHGEGKSK